MIMTEDKTEFAAAYMLTAINAICLKKRNKSMRELMDDEYGHGRLVRPTILTGEVKNSTEFDVALADRSDGTITVRGHGWPMEKKFVWTGSLDEFNKTWEVD